MTLTSEQVLVGVGVLLALAAMWRIGAWRARRAAEAARAGTRAVSLAGRVLFTAAGFLGVQWLVIANPGNTTLLLVVLALSDLIAAYVLTRTLTVASLDTTRRGSRR